VYQYCLFSHSSSQTDRRRRRDDFIKHNQQYKTSSMQPILPLVPERLESDNKDKATFITFDLKVRAGTGAGTPSYKKHMRTFDEDTPQEWMESLTRLREIWQQNSVNGAHDRAATVAAVLKGDSRIAFEAAIEDAWTDPNAAAPIPLTAEHVKVTSGCHHYCFPLSRIGNTEAVDEQVHEEAV
jgi:hypothetical protein